MIPKTVLEYVSPENNDHNSSRNIKMLHGDQQPEPY